MTLRLPGRYRFASPVLVGLLLPAAATAQLPPPEIGPPDPPNEATSFGGSTYLGRHGNVEFGAAAGPAFSAFCLTGKGLART